MAHCCLMAVNYMDECGGRQYLEAGYRVAIAPTSDWNILKPSTPPSSVSLARSGCGIIPSTFLSGLEIPAILSSEPLGLASGIVSPAAVEYRNMMRLSE